LQVAVVVLQFLAVAVAVVLEQVLFLLQFLPIT
jgi:hypothetical protein